MHWSPPSWFFHSAQSETEPKSRYGSHDGDKMRADLYNHEEHEKMLFNPEKQDNIQEIQMDSNSETHIYMQNEIIFPSIVHDEPITEHEEQATQMVPTLAIPGTIKRTLSIMNDAKDSVNKGKMQVESGKEETVTSSPSFAHNDAVCHLAVDCELKSRHQKLLLTSVFLIHPPTSHSSSCPWIITSVEEADGTTQLKHPLSEKPFWDDPNITKFFNLAKLNPTTLAIAHNVSTVKYSRSYPVFDKVLVTSTSSSSVSFGDCTLLALHGGGKLFECPPFDKDDPKLVEIPWIQISCCKDLVFDDIIRYKEMVCALDRKGFLYEIIYHKNGKPHVGKTLVLYPLSGVSGKSQWRKHLVVSPDGKLYMVVKTMPRVLHVYQLVKFRKLYDWSRVRDFEGQVLFMARDYCFFTKASVFPRCQLRDCVVFTADALPRCKKKGWGFGFSDKYHLWYLDSKRASDHAIFKLNGNGVLSWDGQNVGVPKMHWSPPSWFFHSAQSGTETEPKSQHGRNTLRNSHADDKMQGDLHSRDEEHEKMQSNPGKQDNIQMDSNIKKCRYMQKEIISPSIVHDEPVTEHEEQATETVPILATPVTIKRPLSIMNGAKDSVNEASPTRISGKKMRPSIDESKRSERTDTIVTFKGLNMKSSLIPTLENIWNKHGNILEKCTMRNSDVIAVALESLVNMVGILEDNSVISLADSQVKYLSDTLSDVRSMGFKVEWLVPFAEKAIQVHQNKQQLAILKKLGQIKAQTEERRTKLVEELMKIEGLLRGFEEDMTDLSIKICSGKMDLYQPAGAGL